MRKAGEGVCFFKLLAMALIYAAAFLLPALAAAAAGWLLKGFGVDKQHFAGKILGGKRNRNRKRF